jgi:hypothetical protein
LKQAHSTKPDRATPRLEFLNARRKHVTREILCPPLSIALDARNAKVAVGRELTDSNLLSTPGKEKFHRPFRLIPDRRRISPDPKSGQAIPDLPTFHLRPPAEIPHGKSVDKPIPSCKSADSGRTVSAGESLLEKGGQQFDPRDARLASERELTNGNPSRLGSVGESEFADCLC